jgi:hypothetical protein
MSYPAYDAFGKDIRVGFARWRVYMALQPPFLAHDIPTDIKVEVVRHAARTGTRATVAALAWLEEAGYIKVHSRDARGTRRVTLAYTAPQAVPTVSADACTH